MEILLTPFGISAGFRNASEHLPVGLEAGGREVA